MRHAEKHLAFQVVRVRPNVFLKEGRRLHLPGAPFLRLDPQRGLVKPPSLALAFQAP